MSRSKDLSNATSNDVRSFIEELKKAPVPTRDGSRGRLIFALDATQSRQPTWDRACNVQAEMFLEADKLSGIDVQLVFYRGFHECKASRWVSNAADLVSLMTRVDCRAGRTQIERVLRHVRNETKRGTVNAFVFIGDACEESIDDLGDLAGELGVLGVKGFLFQEGGDPTAGRAYRDIAKLTGGAHCQLDSTSPGELRALLGAVAAYASGGRAGMAKVGHRGAVRLIESQIR